MVTFLNRLRAGVKAFTMQFSAGVRWSYGLLSSTRFDYQGEVRDNGRTNSIVMAAVGWLQRTFPEAPLRISQVASGGEKTVARDHPLITLWRRPNPYYSGLILTMALVADWWMTGNGYLIKLRSAAGRVVQLWYVPSWMMEPKWPDGRSDVFISHYEYRPGDGQVYRLEPSDVVHYRYGLDPNNTRKGLSPLACLFREIYTDDEAANYTSSILRNAGIPSVVISPDEGGRISDPEDFRDQIKARFGGDRRGDPLVLGAPAKVTPLAWDPEKLNVRNLRRIPEERITAVLGVPAIVVGLGAGLDRSTFSNVAEAREHAYEGVIIPLQRIFAADTHMQLLPDFVSDIGGWEVDFDTSAVRVLQEDQSRIAERAVVLVKGGLFTVNEGRQLVGANERPEGDVYLVPSLVVPTPPDLLVPPEPEPEEEEEIEDGAPLLEGEEEEPGKWFIPDLGTKGPEAVGAAIVRVRGRLEAAERQAIARELSRQQRAVTTGVRQAWKDAIWIGETKAINLGELVSSFHRQFERRMLQVMERLYRRGLDTVSDLVRDGLDADIDIPQARIDRYLRTAGANIAGITDHTLERVRAELQNGIALGEGVDQLAARLRALPAFSETRAATIAKTELAIATNRAALLTYDVAGIRRVRISDGTDHDEPCASLNGRVVSIREAEGIAPVGHPRCLAGETMVLAPNLSASFSRWFEGEVVVLRTAQNDLLTCTPNHPILSTRGWIAAGVLREGDYVLRCLDGERIVRLLDPDHDHGPALIKDIAHTLGPACGGATATVPTSPVDFHGDGAQGQICVVRTNGSAEHDITIARGTNKTSQIMVKGARVALEPLPSDGFLEHVIPRLRLASDGSVSGGRVGLASIWPESGVLQAMGFVRIADRTVTAQPFTDGGAANIQCGPDFVRTHLLGEIHGSNVFGVRNLLHLAGVAQFEAVPMKVPGEGCCPDPSGLSDIDSALSGLIAPVQVIKIERRQFAGHVYNLETSQHWYIAEHIITHNCVRSFSPVATGRASHNGHVEHKELVEA